MSTNLTMVCRTCDEKGPMVRRTAGNHAQLVAWGSNDPRGTWAEWMLEHEWHDIEGTWD
jgi:hypothetical protein